MTTSSNPQPPKSPSGTHPPTAPTRRSFAKSIAITIAAVFAGALIAIREWYHLRSASAVVVARAGEIPVGGSKIFQYPTDVTPCILVRTGDSVYVAYSRICTHNSCPVSYRPDDNTFDCPCHGGVYSVADGSVLSGPPPRPLPRIQLEIRGTNILATGITST